MEKKCGILYLVPTPIGNMEDMTYRAVRTLAEVDYIAAEDTRHSGILLSHFDIHTPMISYHEHNKAEKGTQLLTMLQEGKSIAVISDAGMPAISDPGADIARRALEVGIQVVPLPGANAGLTALIASGQDTTGFCFIGFLPKKGRHRLEVLTRVGAYEETLIFYEAPHRLREVLSDMKRVLGNRPVAIARELTKRFEEFTYTDLASVVADEESLTLKGEFVIIIGGVKTRLDEDNAEGYTNINDLSYEEEVGELMAKGIAKKEAIREVAKRRGVSRREVYNAVERANQTNSEVRSQAEEEQE